MDSIFPELADAILRIEERLRGAAFGSETFERDRQLAVHYRGELAKLPEQQELVRRWRAGELREVYQGEAAESA